MDQRSDRYRFTVDLIRENLGEAPNIEDVITQLSSEIKRLRSEIEEERIQRVLFGEASGKLAEAVREWFREIHHNNASVYADFAANVIKSGDLIVTFNYDDSAECELKRAGKW